AGADGGVEVLGVDGSIQFLNSDHRVEEVEIRRVAAGEAAEPGGVADEAAGGRADVAVEHGVLDGGAERPAEGAEGPAVRFWLADERLVHGLGILESPGRAGTSGG